MALGLCLALGLGAYVVVTRAYAERAARTERLVAGMKADERYLMRELARFGPGRERRAGPVMAEPGPGCPRARLAVVREWTFTRGASDSGLSGAALTALRRRGYGGRITATVHSGEGSYGVAVKGGDRVFVFGGSGAAGSDAAGFVVYGYVNCSRLGPESMFGG